LPADRRQYIQPVCAMWQTDAYYPTGMVVLTRVRARRIVTALALACHKQWPSHRLNVLPHVPGPAGYQWLSTMHASFQLTFDDHPLGIHETPLWTVTRLSAHCTPPVGGFVPIVHRLSVTTRQSGGQAPGRPRQASAGPSRGRVGSLAAGAPCSRPVRGGTCRGCALGHRRRKG